MKHAILYNPKERRRYTNPVMPFSLLIVAQKWEEEGYNTVIVDGRLGEEVKEHLTRKTERFGTSVMTGSAIEDALMVTKAVKRYNPKIVTTWGGFHPSLMPEQTLKNKYVDEVFQGRYDTKYIDYSLIDIEKYIRNEGGLRTVDVLSSSGCPYRCSYCSIQQMYGRKWIPFDLENHFLPLITRLYESFGVRRLHIMDDNFFIDRKRVEKICDYIIGRGYGLKMWGMCRPNIFARLGDNVLDKLKRAGFETVNLGSESGSQRVLDYIKKDIAVDDSIRVAEICKRYGFNAEFSFMMGFPGEKEEDVELTFGLIDKLTSMIECDIKLFLFCPFPGTPLYEDALLHGLDEPRTLEDWVYFEYEHIKTPWVPEHIRKLFDKATYILWFAFTPSLEQKYAKKWWQRFGYKLLKYDARFRWKMKWFSLSTEWWLVKKIARG